MCFDLAKVTQTSHRHVSQNLAAIVFLLALSDVLYGQGWKETLKRARDRAAQAAQDAANGRKSSASSAPAPPSTSTSGASSGSTWLGYCTAITYIPEKSDPMAFSNNSPGVLFMSDMFQYDHRSVEDQAYGLAWTRHMMKERAIKNFVLVPTCRPGSTAAYNGTQRVRQEMDRWVQGNIAQHPNVHVENDPWKWDAESKANYFASSEGQADLASTRNAINDHQSSENREQTTGLSGGLAQNPSNLANQETIESDAFDQDGEVFYKFADYRVKLFVIQKRPDLLSENFLNEFATSQLTAEQGTWKSWYSDNRGRPIVPKIPPKAWEWQTAIEEQPDFAKDPLIDAFIFPQHEWLFAKSVDPQTPAEVFLFSRKKIEGREQSFVARELHPIVKQQLLIASQKSPRLLWLKVNLPQWDWDGSSVRFLTGNPGTPYIEVVNVLPPASSSSLSLRKTKQHGEYPSFYTFNEGTGKMDLKPIAGRQPSKGVLNAPARWWRDESFLWAATKDHFPILQLMAFNHKIEFPSLQIPASMAEELHKKFAHLSARLFLELAGIELANTKAEDHGFDSLTLLAKVRKIEIINDKDDTTVTSLAASSLPVGSVITPEDISAVPRQTPTRETSSFAESLRKTQQQNQQSSDAARAAKRAGTQTKIRELRIQHCETAAARQAPNRSSSEIHETCVQNVIQRERKQP